MPNFVKRWARCILSQMEAASLHKAILSVMAYQASTKEGLKGVQKVFVDEATSFMESYTSGRYQGSLQEDLASAVAAKIEELNLHKEPATP